MIGAIEQGIIDTLAALSAANQFGYTLQATTYGGTMLTPSGQAQAWLKPPSAVVLFDGAGMERIGPAIWQVSANFHVYAVVQSRRNERALRHGAAGQPGSYQVAEDCAQALAGRTFGLAITPLDVTALEPVPLEEDIAIVRVVLRTAWEIAPVADADALDTLERVWIDWDIPGALPAPETLPAADGEADAQSNIEIEQEP